MRSDNPHVALVRQEFVTASGKQAFRNLFGTTGNVRGALFSHGTHNLVAETDDARTYIGDSLIASLMEYDSFFSVSPQTDVVPPVDNRPDQTIVMVTPVLHCPFVYLACSGIAPVGSRRRGARACPLCKGDFTPAALRGSCFQPGVCAPMWQKLWLGVTGFTRSCTVARCISRRHFDLTLRSSSPHMGAARMGVSTCWRLRSGACQCICPCSDHTRVRPHQESTPGLPFWPGMQYCSCQ